MKSHRVQEIVALLLPLLFPVLCLKAQFLDPRHYANHLVKVVVTKEKGKGGEGKNWDRLLKIGLKASRNQQKKQGLAAALLLAESTIWAFKHVPSAN